MSKKSKQTTSPWKPAQPYLLGAANSLQDVFNQNQPQLQANASLINEGLPGLATKAFGDNPTLMAGQGYAGDVLGGKYLDAGNPYLKGMIDSTNSDIMDRVNGAFGMAGRTGGTQHWQALGRELSNNENALRYGDYSSERDRMGQAAALSPSLYAGEFAGIQPLTSAATVGAGLPYIGADNLAQGLGSIFNGYSTTTQKKPIGEMLLDAANAAARAAAAGGASDRRLKTNIRKLDEAPDGLGIYEFAYKVAPWLKFIGVMADEVENLRPWALGPKMGEFATVNYGAL